MFSLVADYDTTTSSSSTEEDTEDGQKKQKDGINDSNAKPAKTTQLLPSATLLLKSGTTRPTGEIFNNPFLEAEKSKLDKLQKHVKMVDSENHLLQKNGRKICWNNRKGRCRFGNKCKYAHDSDLVIEPTSKTVERNQQIKNPQYSNTKTLESYTIQYDSQNVCNDNEQNRKRPGLCDKIVPGKRVMKSYQKAKKSS